jgi:hypothetical protein
MDSRFTEAQAREFAQIETEAGGVISAGPVLGQRLGEMLHLELFSGGATQLVELVSAQFGTVLSPQEVEELVAGFQAKVQEKVAEKLDARKSA